MVLARLAGSAFPCALLGPHLASTCYLRKGHSPGVGSHLPASQYCPLTALVSLGTHTPFLRLTRPSWARRQSCTTSTEGKASLEVPSCHTVGWLTLVRPPAWAESRGPLPTQWCLWPQGTGCCGSPWKPLLQSQNVPLNQSQGPSNRGWQRCLAPGRKMSKVAFFWGGHEWGAQEGHCPSLRKGRSLGLTLREHGALGVHMGPWGCTRGPGGAHGARSLGAAVSLLV